MKKLHHLEMKLLRRINRDWIHPRADKIMLFFSRIGNFGFIWLLLMFILFFRQTPFDRMTAYLSLIAIGVTVFSIEGVIKQLIRKPRPFTIDAETRLVGPNPGSSSFPSGHAASSFAVALIMSQRGAFGQWDLLLFLLALTIAYSRIYLGVHSPIDVTAGILFGLLWGWGFLALTGPLEEFLAPLEAIMGQSTGLLPSPLFSMKLFCVIL